MKVSTIVEIVGVISIIVSLGFVAIELRHNTNATSAQAYLDLAALANEPLLVLAGDATLAEISLLVSRGENPTTEADLYRYERLVAAIWYSYETTYKVFQKGLLSSDDYSSWLGVSCQDFKRPYHRKLIDSGSIRLNAQFESQLLTNCEGSKSP